MPQPRKSLTFRAACSSPYRMTPDQPRSRQPVFNLPPPVLLLLGALVAVHLWRLTLDETVDLDFVVEHAFVPARMTIALGLGTLDGIVASSLDAFPAESRSAAEPALRAILAEDFSISTLLSYALLHQGWAHLLTNCAFLAAFGRMVALRFGALRFLFFTAVCAALAALGHWTLNMDSYAPVIGASGAVAGLMGGSLRFMFGDHVIMGAGADLSARDPRASLAQTFRNRRAVAFTVVLLASNILIGLGAGALTPGVGAIAWLVHVAGFAAGLFLFPLFDPITGDRDRYERL